MTCRIGTMKYVFDVIVFLVSFVLFVLSFYA